MSFQSIRAHIETKVNDAFAAMSPAVPVVWDNVQDTPPDLPYVLCTISFTATTIPVVCVTDGQVENINGNLQLACYAPRGKGMKQLEQMGSTSMLVINSLFDWGQSGEGEGRPN